MSGRSDPTVWLRARSATYSRYAELVGEQAAALLDDDFDRIRSLDGERERLAARLVSDPEPEGLELALASSPAIGALMAEASQALARAMEADRAYQQGLRSVMEAARAGLAEMEEGEGSSPARGYRGRGVSGSTLDFRR